MTDKWIHMPQGPIPVGGAKPAGTRKTEQAPKGAFDQILAQKLEQQAGVKFSAHAQKRLESRGIKLNEATLNGIKNAVDMASKKGARESLLLLDDLALIVSIKNRTVITAVDGDSMKDNVFTNIDSAVIV